MPPGGVGNRLIACRIAILVRVILSVAGHTISARYSIGLVRPLYYYGWIVAYWNYLQ